MSPSGEASLRGLVGPGGAKVEEFGATLSLSSVSHHVPAFPFLRQPPGQLLNILS